MIFDLGSSSHRLTRSKGATRYASARAMKYEDLSRRDDVESWCYMMLEVYGSIGL